MPEQKVITSSSLDVRPRSQLVANSVKAVGALALLVCCSTNGASAVPPSTAYTARHTNALHQSCSTNSLKALGITYNGSTLSERCVDMESQGENMLILDSLQDLEYDWDFNGAPPIPKGLINKVRGLVYGLVVQPEIIPTPRKSIQFEYIASNKDYLEIELFASGLARAMCRPTKGTATVVEIPFTLDAVNKVVESFYARGTS